MSEVQYGFAVILQHFYFSEEYSKLSKWLEVKNVYTN